jgi:3-methyladenine DNA glycosylase/8-oxoguanine DNA glycosylase
MRVCKDPNAFLHNDWVVLKQLAATPARAGAQAGAWQPWRAYALMYLWFAAGQRRSRLENR